MMRYVSVIIIVFIFAPALWAQDAQDAIQNATSGDNLIDVTAPSETPAELPSEASPEVPISNAPAPESPQPEGEPAPTEGQEKSLYDLMMTKGIISHINEDYAGAEEEFRAALEINPGSFEATLYLGMTLSRQGKKDAAFILKKALAMDPEQQRTTMELGKLYYEKGIYAEALDFFEITVAIDPQSPIAVEAADYVKKIWKAWSKRRWSVDFSTGFQYDSNVALNSADAGASGASDTLTYLTFGAGYDFLRWRNLQLNAGYSLFRSLHQDLEDYDATVHDVSLKADYALPRNALFGLSFSYGNAHIGSSDYSETYTLRPTLLIPEGKSYSTILQVVYTDSKFKESDLFHSNSDRSGTEIEAGIAQHIQLSDDIKGRAGYAYSSAEAEKDYWSFGGHKVFISVDALLPYGVRAILAGEYQMRDFDGISPITGGRREDRVQAYSLTARREISENFEISARQVYVLHDSTVWIYDYTRSISTLMFSVRL